MKGLFGSLVLVSGIIFGFISLCYLVYAASGRFRLPIIKLRISRDVVPTNPNFGGLNLHDAPTTSQISPADTPTNIVSTTNSGTSGTAIASIQTTTKRTIKFFSENYVKQVLAKFLKPYREDLFLEHHNLMPSDVERYNVTCPPKLWLLLGGQYRTFGYLRSNMRRFLELSAGECWFVTFLNSGDSTGKDRHENDFDFFYRRLAYLSLTRSDAAQHDKFGNFDTFWEGSWIIGSIIRFGLPVLRTVPSTETVVVRHRPDLCFHQCLNVNAAANLFKSWPYLVFGHAVSGDLHLVTSWQGYEDNIGRPMRSQRHIADRNGWQRFGFYWGDGPGDVNRFSPSESCLIKQDSAPCLMTRFRSQEVHCLCRADGCPTPSGQDRFNPDVDVNCVDVTLTAHCVHPRNPENWALAPVELRPVDVGDLQDVGGYDWITPYGGWKECKTPFNFTNWHGTYR